MKGYFFTLAAWSLIAIAFILMGIPAHQVAIAFVCAAVITGVWLFLRNRF